MRSRHRLQRAPWVASLACAAGSAVARAQSSDSYEQEPIRYSTSAPRDAVARLEARLSAGAIRFAGDERAVVRALLEALAVPVASQLLVFSKTSLQRDRISPETPRALYFSDDVYVGWVPGGLVEVASIDPELGPIFYRFDPRAAAEGRPAGEAASDAPASAPASRFVRDRSCLSCHGGQFVRDIPGLFARSVHVEPTGEPMFRFGSVLVDETTPFEKRFGGWYVTGTHGRALHRGNVFTEDVDGRPRLDLAAGANVVDLAGRFPAADYLAPGSDLVAHLVQLHQLTVHDALTRAAFQCRRMLHYQHGVQRDLKEPVTAEPTWESVVAVFERSAQELTDALLSHGAAPLPEGGVRGDPAFQLAYAATAKRNSAGDSLRDLDLATRLYRNRLSPLIESESFAALPAPLLQRVWTRLAAALRPGANDPRYAYLRDEERARIVAILRATRRDLPEGWLDEG